MTLLAISLVAVFLFGIALGAFLLVVIGIHVEERKLTRTDSPDSRTAVASRRLLATGLARDEARR